MSIQSLKNRLFQSLNLYREGLINLEELKQSVFLNGRALEMMPYPLIKEIDAIGYELEIIEGYIQNGFEADVDSVLSQLEVCLNYFSCP